MPLPSTINDLSTTANDNYPKGSENPFPLNDDFLRTIQAFIASLRDSGGGYLSSVSGVDTITATLTGLSSYLQGAMFAFVPAGSNTGAVTLNIGGLGAKAVTYRGAALAAGLLSASVPVFVVYDGTNFDVMADPTPVDRFSAQTIAGIKTFTSSPVVPTVAPGDNTTKAANTAFVTGAIGAISTPAATETTAGIAELATQAETDARSDDERIVTPKKLGNGFAVSLAANGYIKLPSWLGGWHVQWGNASVSANFVLDATLPSTFSASHLIAFGSLYTSSNGADRSVGAVPSSTSVVRLVNNNPSTQNVAFLCIGN